MFFIRPDAVSALENEGVLKGLPRYVKVVKDRLPAKFMIARKVPVNFDEGSSEKELREIHNKAMGEFREIEKKIDSKELDLNEMKEPKQSLLHLKKVIADRIMTHCHFCERRCGINRTKGEMGFCRATTEWKIFGAHPHYGEEAELVPSGTIFSAACTMKCVYCQNAPESITPELGEKWKIEEVVNWIREIRARGIRNINWVGGSPTPYTWQIISAINMCDINVPMVWNSNSYYSEETAKLIDGIIDVYLLDFRYFNENCGVRLSETPNYPEAAKRNHLTAEKAGELLIRILAMPGHIECDAKPIIKWIKDNLREWTRVNILGQYRPYWKADKYPGINRPLERSEWREVVDYAKGTGIKNLVRY